MGSVVFFILQTRSLYSSSNNTFGDITAYRVIVTQDCEENRDNMEDDVTCELSKIKQKPLSKSDVLAEVETKESCYNGVTVKMETGNDIDLDYGVVAGDRDLKDFKYDEFGENETNICLEIKAEPTIKE